MQEKEGCMLNLIGERRRIGGLGFLLGCIKKLFFFLTTVHKETMIVRCLIIVDSSGFRNLFF